MKSDAAVVGNWSFRIAAENGSLLARKLSDLLHLEQAVHGHKGRVVQEGSCHRLRHLVKLPVGLAPDPCAPGFIQLPDAAVAFLQPLMPQ
ncbi:hypothetical protein D3C81_1591230 [compost metagenome]